MCNKFMKASLLVIFFTSLGSAASAQIAVRFSASDGALVQQRLIPPPCNSFTMQEAERLTWHQKFCYFSENRVLTGSAVFGSLFFSGVAQIRNDPKEWNQGVEGYAKRVGTRYAQGLAKSTAEFLAGALNREDPRSSPPATPGKASNKPESFTLKHRVGSALLRTVWTRRYNGTHGIAFSKIAGALTSGFIGNAWYPDRLRTPGQAFARSGSAMGGYVMSSLFSEFQPDVFGMVKKLLGLGNPK
jgi:hypothetical protein